MPGSNPLLGEKVAQVSRPARFVEGQVFRRSRKNRANGPGGREPGGGGRGPTCRQATAARASSRSVRRRAANPVRGGFDSRGALERSMIGRRVV